MDAVLDFLRGVMQFEPASKFMAVMVVIFLDAVLGVLVAVRNDTFQWELVPQFIKRHVVSFGGGLGILLLLTVLLPDDAIWATLYTAGVAATMAKFVVSVVTKFTELTGIVLPGKTDEPV